MSWFENILTMLDEAAERTARLSNPRSRPRTRSKRDRERLARKIKALLAVLVAPFLVIPTMIASGLLLGPKGYEGIFLAPLVMIVTWAAILYWGFAKRSLPPLPALKADNSKASLLLLPAQTGEWLEEERRMLPSAAQRQLDSLSQHLSTLAPQLQSLDPEAPAAHEVRRLLCAELPELVRGYRKVPTGLAQQPLYGGATPERQLVEGLETIDQQIARMHERLATDDLHALATHQRFLELKYKKDDDDVS